MSSGSLGPAKQRPGRATRPVAGVPLAEAPLAEVPSAEARASTAEERLAFTELHADAPGVVDHVADLIQDIRKRYPAGVNPLEG